LAAAGIAGLLAAAPSLAQTPITLRLAHTDSPDTYNSKKHAFALMFKNIVESKTQGQVQVQVFPANQLGGEREIVEGVNLGTLDIALTSDGGLSGFYPPSMVLSIPYLFGGYEEAWKVLDGEFGAALAKDMLARTGMRTLGYAQTGFRHFMNAKREVRSPEDMKGLKIRVMQSPLYMTMVNSLGASPTPVPWPEVYSAAQQGVVDGMELPIGSVLMVKLYEVQKFMVLDGHTFSTDFLLINERKFQSLPKMHQNVVLEAGQVGATAGRAIEALNSALGAEELVKRGMKLYAPTAEQMAGFRKLSQEPVLTWLRGELKQDAAWVDRVVKAVESERRK
jgi:tripartite ATP-independent transporter DctP family solute receptor